MPISERRTNNPLFVAPNSVSRNETHHAQPGGSDTFESALDPLGQYLSEIRAAPLLNAKEEIELGRSVQAGIEAQRFIKENGYSLELGQIVQRGQGARTKLTESNLRLVVSVAKKYVGRGLDILDLIQEGNIGLFKAVDRYDPEPGFRFSTYARWWIRQAVTRAIQDQGRTIRHSVYIQDALHKIATAKKNLPIGLGREPTDQEVAQELGIGVDRLREILSCVRPTISLDIRLNRDDKDETIGDFITAEGPSVQEEGEKRVLQAEVQGALDRLSPRERRLIELRFGLTDGVARTLEEIGIEFGVSRERIRQMETQALRNLGIQNPELRRHLK